MRSRSTTGWMSRQSRASITTRRKMASLRVSLQRRQTRLKEHVRDDISLDETEKPFDVNPAKRHTMLQTMALTEK